MNIPLAQRRAWGADEDTPQIRWGETGIPGYDAYDLFPIVPGSREAILRDIMSADAWSEVDRNRERDELGNIVSLGTEMAPPLWIKGIRDDRSAPKPFLGLDEATGEIITELPKTPYTTPMTEAEKTFLNYWKNWNPNAYVPEPDITEIVDTSDPRFWNTEEGIVPSLSGTPSPLFSAGENYVWPWNKTITGDGNGTKEEEKEPDRTETWGDVWRSDTSKYITGDGNVEADPITYTPRTTTGGEDTMSMADFIRDIESQTRAGRQAQFERYRDLGGFNRFLNPQAQDVMRYQQFGPLSSQYLLAAAPFGTGAEGGAGGYAGFQNVGAGEASFPEYLGGLAPTYTAAGGYADAPTGAAGFGVPTGGAGAFSPWSREQWQGRIGALYGGNPAGGMPGVGTAAANFLSVLSEPEVADIIRSTMMAGVNPIMQRYAPGAIRSMINRYRAGAPEVAPSEMLRQFAAGGYTGLPPTV